MFPNISDEEWEKLKTTTLIGGHCNAVNRCYYYTCCCNSGHEKHCSSARMTMNMDWLREVHPQWVQAIEQGSVTYILRKEIRTQDLLGMVCISQADNVKHGASLVEHSLQLVKRLQLFCVTETSVLGTVNKDMVLRRFIAGCADMDLESAECLYAFVLRCSDGVCLPELEAFRQCWVKELTESKKDLRRSLLLSLFLSLTHTVVVQLLI